jgi:Protein of unknown function (DUF1592)/Protein of unknown function (DUF1588)/Protein of unknown function (DUF1595)/Protein of unknown function (DUF1585)
MEPPGFSRHSGSRRFARALATFALLLTIPLALATAYGATGDLPSDGKAAAASVAPAATEPDAASPMRVRLISQDQYFNTLSYVFGPEIAIAAHFAPFQRTDGLLEIGSATAGVTVGQMQEFQRAAATVAGRVVSPEFRNFLVPCTPRHDDAADKSCAAQFLVPVGRLLYRRPLTRDEQKDLVDSANEGAGRLKDFYAGLAVALEGLLISPNTLFIIDHPEPDPVHPGHQRLDAYSLASRLSFFLWDAAPDDALLKVAEHGELQTAAGKAKAVDRMLKSTRLVTGVRAFFDDMLGFDDFAVLSKDPDIYPAFAGDTVQDAREQTLRILVDHLLVRKRDYRDLFTTRDIFVSPSLAPLYGVAPPPGWTPYEIPANSERVGLLTQIAFLAAHAHPGRSSATLRGKALRELLLCQMVPRPPPNVDFSLIEDPKSTLHTARERLTAHRANPVCAGCHKITDPIGLALENFDGAGQFRETERGAPIDASGTLDGKSYTDAVGLAQAVHDHPGVPTCLVKRVYTYGIGGSVKSNDNDKAALKYFDARFAEEGYRLPDLLRTIALSTAFSEVTERAVPTAPTKAAEAASPRSPPLADGSPPAAGKLTGAR